MISLLKFTFSFLVKMEDCRHCFCSAELGHDIVVEVHV